jgi:hypothetical protein
MSNACAKLDKGEMLAFFFKMAILFTSLTWPISGLYFFFQYGFLYGIALGFLCALAAGLTIAQALDDIRTLKINKLKKASKEKR